MSQTDDTGNEMPSGLVVKRRYAGIGEIEAISSRKSARSPIGGDPAANLKKVDRHWHVDRIVGEIDAL